MVKGYDVWADIWPGQTRGQPLAPVGVGMDRRTGKMLVGWPHVEQSIELLFVTRYHERVLRYWVGSFVPHMLGENATIPTITRFFWAIATAIELWEPRYAVQYVRIMNKDGSYPEDFQVVENLTSAEELRRGEVSFQMAGVYMPRGHLGDKTPDSTRNIILIGTGNNQWERRSA